MSDQHTNEKKSRTDYENSVAVLVDGFLYELEKNLTITEGSRRDSDWFSGDKMINADVTIKNLDNFKKKLIENAEEFGERVPNEKLEWKSVVCYFEVNSLTLKLQNEGGVDKMTPLGSFGAGAAIGSVIPGIGTAVGALIGGGIGFLREQSRRKNRMTTNNQEFENAKRKAIEQIRANRQKIIDAILASNH